MGKVQPIKPSEIVKLKKEIIPDEVLRAFNELIAHHWNGTSSTFRQAEVIKLIESKFEVNGETYDLFNNNWLDVEPIYQKFGWKIKYEKSEPGFNDDAYFEFSIKTRGE